MRNSVLEFCSIAHHPNFIPDELLHLAHKPFESGVDWPVRISYARLNPGLGWATTKFVTHLPPRPCAKNETVKQGIAGQPIGAVHACSGGLACCIQRRQAGTAFKVRTYAAHGVVRGRADRDEISSDIDVVLQASRVDARKMRLHVG